jgi:hypothetical protein
MILLYQHDKAKIKNSILDIFFISMFGATPLTNTKQQTQWGGQKIRKCGGIEKSHAKSRIKLIKIFCMLWVIEKHPRNILSH